MHYDQLQPRWCHRYRLDDISKSAIISRFPMNVNKLIVLKDKDTKNPENTKGNESDPEQLYWQFGWFVCVYTDYETFVIWNLFVALLIIFVFYLLIIKLHFVVVVLKFHLLCVSVMSIQPSFISRYIFLRINWLMNEWWA